MVYNKTPIHELERRLSYSKTKKEILGKQLDRLEVKLADMYEDYSKTSQYIRSLTARLREAKKPYKKSTNKTK